MNIETKIERFLVEEILLGDRQTKIDPDQMLIEAGILDSLTLLRLITFVEDQFGVMVDDGEVVPDNFQSIRMTSAFIEKKMQGQ
ncbi:MAG: acyl carrier protein [Anaerolineaceae bacterium]|nr:acyl carrier protein [Anaerolineaceae bacterium]